MNKKTTMLNTKTGQVLSRLKIYPHEVSFSGFNYSTQSKRNETIIVDPSEYLPQFIKGWKAAIKQHVAKFDCG